MSQEHDHKKPEDEKNKTEIKDEELDKVSGGGRGATMDQQHVHEEVRREGVEKDRHML